MKESSTYFHKFQSIGQRYKGPEKQDLQLKIVAHGKDILEVELINENYIRCRNSFTRQCAYLTFVVIAIIYMKIYYNIYTSILLIIVILWLIILLCLLSTLVKLEKFTYCYSFGLHLQVVTFLGQSNYFITASKIHDIVINEVLENFDFYYLLIVRTSQNLFHKKPIIPVFKYLKPSADCLDIIYKHLKRVMRASSSQSESIQ